MMVLFAATVVAAQSARANAMPAALSGAGPSRWLTYALLAGFFLLLILLLRALFGPSGKLREPGWETIQQAQERERRERDAREQATRTPTDTEPRKYDL